MARPRTICLLLALLTVLAYSPLRHASSVVFDDPDYIGDPHVQAGLTLAGVQWAFTTWHASNWHPLTWLSLMLDASLFGPNPGAEHLVNVVLHAANVLLLFLLLYRATEKLWPAAFVAALFAWHPLHVESVAWISERKDVLSTFFGLLTLLAYMRYARESKLQNSKAKKSYALTLALFALGLMAKPMLVTLPFVMLLLDVWPFARFGGVSAASADNDEKNQGGSKTFLSLLVEKAPFFLLTLLSCVITFLAQRSEAVLSLEQCPFGLRVENAVVACAEYLTKTFWPAHLAVIYPLPLHIPAWQIAGATVVLLVISFFAWLARKRRPYFTIGWLWFLGTLVPVIGLVQVGGQALADRYTYFPLIGIFIAIAYGAADLLPRFRVPVAATSTAAALTLSACLCLTWRQLGFWQDSVKLFRHAIAVTSGNAIAHINLGVALEQNDDSTGARAEYLQSIAIDPNRFQAHNNLANLLAATGAYAEALEEYQEALRLDPNAATAHLNYGTLLSEMGRFDDAMREYAEAARLAPGDVRPQYLMGKACLRHGQSAEAVKHFRDALGLAPDDFETLTWLARVLASDEDPAVRNAADAVSLAQRADAITDGEQPFVLDTLGMAFAQAGRFKDAQDAVQKAIERTTAAGSQKTVPEMQQRLQLYQSGQPYFENFSKTLAQPK